jgi:hypothetical protein
MKISSFKFSLEKRAGCPALRSHTENSRFAWQLSLCAALFALLFVARACLSCCHSVCFSFR